MNQSQENVDTDKEKNELMEGESDRVEFIKPSTRAGGPKIILLIKFTFQGDLFLDFLILNLVVF